MAAAAVALPKAAPPATRGADCAPLFSIGFELAEAEPLAPDLAGKVGRLARWLDAHREARLIIEGHTDTLGAEAYNLALSQKRANAVARLMLGAGTPAERLVSRGFAGQKPLEGVAGTAASNRRAEMRIAGAPECPSGAGAGDRR